MLLNGEWVKAIFMERLNRFEAIVLINGEIERVHVPNTGRMKELLHQGTEVILKKSTNPNRKTKYSLFFVKKNGHMICINSVMANDVFEDGIRSGKINWLEGEIKREVGFHNSRIDFFIDGREKTFVEVKCGTYEENGVVMFPDAPTERGRKHVDELITAVKDGYRAAVVIVAFMDYTDKFTPNYRIDKEFGEKLQSAFSQGVEVKAYNCIITLKEVTINKELEVCF